MSELERRGKLVKNLTKQTETSIAVPPAKYRDIVIALYRVGDLTWGEAFSELYNAGWRGKLADPSNRRG